MIMTSPVVGRDEFGRLRCSWFEPAHVAVAHLDVLQTANAGLDLLDGNHPAAAHPDVTPGTWAE